MNVAVQMPEGRPEKVYNTSIEKISSPFLQLSKKIPSATASELENLFLRLLAQKTTTLAMSGALTG